MGERMYCRRLMITDDYQALGLIKPKINESRTKESQRCLGQQTHRRISTRSSFDSSPIFLSRKAALFTGTVPCTNASANVSTFDACIGSR